MPPVISSLATYAGERKLEIRLYDADEERLDLMDRFARHCFHFTDSTHDALFRPDPSEALEGVDRIVLMMGRNCARRYLGMKFSDEAAQSEETVSKALEEIFRLAPTEADVLSLQGPSARIPLGLYRRMDWPGDVSEDDLRFLPHQILRWLKSEEQIYKFLDSQQTSPLKTWLDDPNAAELVVNRSAVV
jgi:hypothetical protein